MEKSCSEENTPPCRSVCFSLSHNSANLSDVQSQEQALLSSASTLAPSRSQILLSNPNQIPTINLRDSSATTRLTFKVEGEGVLPMVKVINPHSPPHCSTLLSFKSHTLNNQVCKIVSLCNQQSIPCGVCFSFYFSTCEKLFYHFFYCFFLFFEIFSSLHYFSIC